MSIWPPRPMPPKTYRFGVVNARTTAWITTAKVALAYGPDGAQTVIPGAPVTNPDPMDRRYDIVVPSTYFGQVGTLTVIAQGYVTEQRPVTIQPSDPGIIDAPGVALTPVGPSVPTVQPPRFIVNGNFMAAPGFELDKRQIPGHLYGAMTPEQRTQYQAVMREHGWTTMPISPFSVASPTLPWGYDFTDDIPAYVALLQEARAGGIEPLAMTMTDRPGNPWRTVDEARRYIDKTLPHYKDQCAGFSYAWESNDCTEVHMAPEQQTLQRHIKDIIGSDYPLWVHVAPRWWSPSYTVESGLNEWDFWSSSRGVLYGLLYQIEPNDPNHQVNYYLHEMFPIRGVSGIVGRLCDALGYELALFEFGRNFTDWQRVKDEAQAHPHAAALRGFC